MNDSPSNNSIAAILKFIGALLLLPFAWTTSASFHKYIIVLPGTDGEFFFWGMFGFLLCFLFFFQFWGVYELGQKITSGLFRFMTPANNFTAQIIPFYLTGILLIKYVLTNFLEISHYDQYLMFFAGFAFTMHVLLTAMELQQREFGIIKPNYLFMIVINLILMIFVVVLLFDLMLGQFTFLTFVKSAISDALNVYYAAGERLTIIGNEN